MWIDKRLLDSYIGNCDKAIEDYNDQRAVNHELLGEKTRLLIENQRLHSTRMVQAPVESG